MKFAGSWSVINQPKTVPVQERFMKLKAPSFPVRRSHVLDRVEARSAWFTELQSYWSVPISDTGTVAALAVSEDTIHVLTTNPLSIFSMTKESEKTEEISIQGLIAAARGNRPQFTMTTDNSGNVLVHEETVRVRENRDRRSLN